MGSVYRFITRTVLYNIIRAIRNIARFVFKIRASFTGTFLLLLLAIAMVVSGPIYEIKFDGNAIISGSAMVLGLLLILGSIINFMWLRIEENCETNEPKFVKWIASGIGAFFKDITRPPDEQEELDRERKAKAKEENARIKAEKAEKKRLAREAKNAERNKYDRFEIMEVEQ